MRSFRVLLVLLALPCIAVALEKKPTGMLAYPLVPLVDPAEGTIEFWAKLQIDVRRVLPQEDFMGLVTLFGLHFEGGDLGVGYFAGSNFRPDAGLWLRLAPRDRLESIGYARIFEQGEWFHFAFTWKDNVTTLYIDGEEVARTVHTVRLAEIWKAPAPRSKEKPFPFYFGDRWGYGARFAIDELRVSLVAREPEELGFHGKLEPDPLTSLLDSFEGDEKVEDAFYTRPAVILQGRGGWFNRGWTIPGKHGFGLSLYPVEEQALLPVGDRSDDEPPVMP